MTEQQAAISKWPHRWAWILCVATFPLLWIGGLITTTDAGMAVPDWPGTYGYNMFLYPWQTWFYGPWDLFIEHGHRLFASGVGLLTILFLAIVWRNDQRRWLRWLAVVALMLVITQGALGGMRVVLNERLLAMLHGCTGPLFFALTAALVVLTSPRRGETSPWPGWRALWLPILIYLQITAGASLRHVPEGGSFITFSHHVLMHVTLATLIFIGICYNTYYATFYQASLSSSEARLPARKRLSILLMLAVLVQISLGIGTWYVKYRLPDWLNNPASQYATIHHWAQSLWPVTLTGKLFGEATLAEGWSETHTVTAHSAIGSLLLALATALAFLPKNNLTTELASSNQATS